MKTIEGSHTITEKWLNGRTFLDTNEDWYPGSRKPEYRAVPGHRCPCGNIYRVGSKVSITGGTKGGKSHMWATCSNCGTCMF